MKGRKGEREKRGKEEGLEKIKIFRDLNVYKSSFDASMTIFEYSKTFPREEKYSLIDQIRRSSRSVCSNIAEAWHKRRYKAAFIAKLSDAEAEAAETQVWLDFSLKCGYLDKDQWSVLNNIYEKIIRQIITMIKNPTKWTFSNLKD